MKRLVIVGNGFDLAHDLNTSYKDFIDSNLDKKSIRKYKEYLLEMNSDNNFYSENQENTWYYFEQRFEELILWNYGKAFSSEDKEIDYEVLYKELNDLNATFEEIRLELKEYLEKEYKSKEINCLDNVKRMFDKETFVLSYNYTDTIKLYTDNYVFVHGSISEEDHIVLGFAIGEMPCLCSGNYNIFHKDLQKEELSFHRFLIKHDCKNINDELMEFKRHAISLFSNRGEYDLPINEENPDESDISELSDMLKMYAKENNFEPASEEYDYSNVEELVIMGHGLESDIIYLDGILANLHNLKKAILFTFEGEKCEELMRKQSFIMDKTGLKSVEIIKYK